MTSPTKRVMANGFRHKETKLFDCGAAVPQILLNKNETIDNENFAESAPSFPAVWLRLRMPVAVTEDDE